MSQLTKISTCTKSKDNNIILGTRRGHLIMYSVDENWAGDILIKPVTTESTTGETEDLTTVTRGKKKDMLVTKQEQKIYRLLEAIIRVDNIGKWKLLLVWLMSLEVDGGSELTTDFLQNELQKHSLPSRFCQT
uniref:Uncharacterized protein n=1 Tax=Glossina austeni TaxID=7395 RepID=A0A1A9VS61_GLOAU